jgi:osmotically-inducible protein OsmY
MSHRNQNHPVQNEADPVELISQPNPRNRSAVGQSNYEGSRSFQSTMDYQGYKSEQDYDNEGMTSDEDFGYHGNLMARERNEGENENANLRGNFSGVGPKTYQRLDSSIFEEVCETLTEADGIDPSDIEVGIKNGIITLKGTVETRLMKRMAEDVAESIRGVLHVENHLTIVSLNRPTP